MNNGTSNLKQRLLAGDGWAFAPILLAGIVLNLVAIWSVSWLPLTDLGGWIELMDVMARHGDPATIYAQVYRLPTGPEPNMLALAFGWLVIPLIPANVAAQLLISFYVVGLPLGMLAVCRAFDRSKWLALFSLPLTFNAMFMMGFLNYLIAVPFLFLAIALSRALALRGGWWRGALLATCLVALYFGHVLTLLCGWCVCLAVLVLSTEPRRIHLRLWPLLPVVPLFAWWYWRMFVALEATEAGWTFGTAEGFLLDNPGLDQHFAKLHKWGMQSFRDSTEEIFVIVLALVWLAMIASSQLGRASGRDRSGLLAFTRRHALELVTLCCMIVYFWLPFDMNSLCVIGQRVIIIIALLVSVWPRLELDRWSRRALLVPLVAAVIVFALLVGSKFRRFEREMVGEVPGMIADLPDRSRLAYVKWHNTNRLIHKGSVWHLAEAMHSTANGGITDNSFAKQVYTPIRYRKGQTPRRRLGRKFWRKPQLGDYDYVLLRALYRPEEALSQEERIRLVASQGEWWLFEVLVGDGS